MPIQPVVSSIAHLEIMSPASHGYDTPCHISIFYQPNKYVLSVFSLSSSPAARTIVSTRLSWHSFASGQSSLRLHPVPRSLALFTLLSSFSQPSFTSFGSQTVRPFIPFFASSTAGLFPFVTTPISSNLITSHSNCSLEMHRADRLCCGRPFTGLQSDSGRSSV
jgi:hypothetical protein